MSHPPHAPGAVSRPRLIPVNSFASARSQSRFEPDDFDLPLVEQSRHVGPGDDLRWRVTESSSPDKGTASPPACSSSPAHKCAGSSASFADRRGDGGLRAIFEGHAIGRGLMIAPFHPRAGPQRPRKRRPCHLIPQN